MDATKRPGGAGATSSSSSSSSGLLAEINGRGRENDHPSMEIHIGWRNGESAKTGGRLDDDAWRLANGDGSAIGINL